MLFTHAGSLNLLLYILGHVRACRDRFAMSVGGDLFITPEVSFLTAPTAVDTLLGLIRKRGHSFTRPDIYRGLGDAGCLVGTWPGVKRHTRWARLKAPGWRAPIRVQGLAIAHDALWDV